MLQLKLIVARAQLGTATDLFVRNREPVSIQCLACAAGELLDGIGKAGGHRPFSTEILDHHPDLDDAQLKGIRNKYWNAFKHLSGRNGSLRVDMDIIRKFDDAQNDAPLFCAWRDYFQVTGSMPIAAQVLQMWWYALYEDKLGPAADLVRIHKAFPRIREMSRPDQKDCLRRSVEKWRKNTKLLADSRTEPHLLSSWSQKEDKSLTGSMHTHHLAAKAKKRK